MLGDKESDSVRDLDCTPAEMEDESESSRAPSLEEIRAGFMLLDL
jgi:hypothetical protein